MNAFPRVAALLAAAFVTAAPAFAQSTSSTTTSAGVTVIDMNPQPVSQKSGTAPAPKPSAPPSLAASATLLQFAMAYVGAPYKMGAAGPSQFDCSGFTQFAYRSIGIVIPRTADQQFYRGRTIAGDPLPGDLVFFQTYEYGPSHVGIYLGDGKFLSAVGQNVHVDTFENGYYKSRYLGARRYLPG